MQAGSKLAKFGISKDLIELRPMDVENLQVCMYVCMYVFMFACMHVCMYMCRYVKT